MACRVHGDPESGVRSVEIVAAPGTDTAALAEAARRELAEMYSFDLPTASVAVTRLPDGSPEEAEAQAPETRVNGKRAKIQNVSIVARDARAEARVALSYQGRDWLGVSEGPNTSGRRLRLIAEATLSGLEEILSDPHLFSVEDLRVVEMLDGPVAVVVLELTGRRQGQRLSGSCPVASAHGSIEEAVVRGTLQAVNRLFTSFAKDQPQPS